MPDPIENAIFAREQPPADFISPALKCIGFVALAAFFLGLAVGNHGVDNSKATGLAFLSLACVLMVGSFGIDFYRAIQRLNTD